MMRTRRNRGVLSMSVLALMPIVALTLAGLTAMFADYVRQTQAVGRDAQLRQLLHAGAVAAVDAANRGDAIDVALPVKMAGRGAAVKVNVSETESADERRVEVVAKFKGRSMTQHVTLLRADDQWSVVGATLKPSVLIR